MKYIKLTQKVVPKKVQKIFKKDLIVERIPKELKQQIINQAAKKQCLNRGKKDLLSVDMTDNSFKKQYKQCALGCGSHKSIKEKLMWDHFICMHLTEGW